MILFDSGSKINTIYPTFAKELGLSIRPTDVRVQKIDSTMLYIYEMVVAAFSMINKANQIKFFEKIVFKMLFLILNGVDVDFFGWELW